jgi:hypothetical protein
MQANFNIPDSENRGGLLKIYGALCETPETAKAMYVEILQQQLLCFCFCVGNFLAC